VKKTTCVPERELARKVNVMVNLDAQAFHQHQHHHHHLHQVHLLLHLLHMLPVSRKERTDLASQISNAVVIEHAMKKDNVKVILTAQHYL